MLLNLRWRTRAVGLGLWAMTANCSCPGQVGVLGTSSSGGIPATTGTLGRQGTGTGTGATGGATGSTTASFGSSGGGTGGARSDGGGIFGQQTTPQQTASVDDAGSQGSGVENLSDGGELTLGPAYNFNSYFAYLSNSAQAAGASFVSRVNTQTGQEEARYPSVIPLDNNGKSICTKGQPGSCLVDLDVTYYDNAPSRTVVDLSGGVFVANRGQCDWQVCTADTGARSYVANNPDSVDPTVPADAMIGAVQGSVSYIANRVDHPEQCAPRCQNRRGWNLPDGGPAIFSSGYSIPGVGSIPANEVLMPSPAGGDAGALAAYSPDVVNHPCLDNGAHDPTDVTDPTNYDDCTRFTIPLGAPNGYDLLVQTRYSDRFAPRGIAISRNCGTLSGQTACDVYVGLTEPGPETSQFVHLGYKNNFDVVDTIESGVPSYGAYGAAIDCDGLLWYGHSTQAAAIDTSTDTVASTWSFNDGGGVATVNLVTDTAKTNICAMYGVAVDTQGHFWSDSLAVEKSGNTAGACAFDYGTFFNDTHLHDGSLDYGTAMTQVASLFHHYPIGATFDDGGVGSAGIVADENGNAYFTLTGGVGAAAVNFQGTGPACGVNGDSSCLWVSQNAFATPLNSSWGIDLDQDGNPLVTERGPGGVTGLDSVTGSPLALYTTDAGAFGTRIGGPSGVSDLYTYSDFTGYALRHITQPEGIYRNIFQACAAGGTMTWQTLNYSADIPAGSDISFEVDTADDPAAFSNSGTTGPQILGTWTCSSAATCPSPAALTGLGSTTFAQVTAKLQGPHCSSESGPVLRWVTLSYDCEPAGVNK